MSRFLISALLLIQIPSLMAANLKTWVTENKPEQVVADFQKLPHHELFCKNATWGSSEPISVGSKFKTFYSKEFYKLFLWAQCITPLNTPPHYQDLDYNFFWDIRFGLPKHGVDNREGTIEAKAIRIQSVKFQGPSKATVKVLFNFGTLKNLPTTYTVIQEDRQWKIDDIAPSGDFVEGANEDQQDSLLKHSKSIKTEMKNNYRKAEARYLKEQSIKTSTQKP